MCAALVSCHCGVGLCGCCCGWGLSPPSPLVSFFFAGEGASWRVVSWLCGVRRWLSRSRVWCSPSPLPLLFGLRLRVCFLLFSLPALARYVSACSGCPFFWWAAALGWLSPVLAGWSFGVPSGGPVVGAVWLGGLAASCGWAVLWLWAFLVPPPPLSFFWLGVCLFLPLPSLGWCTHWSAFSVVNRVAVGACVLLGLGPPHGSGGLCTPLARWPSLPG